MNRFPRNAVSPEQNAREPRRSLPLPLLYAAEGALTAPIYGHYFTVAPVGTAEKVDVSPPATFLAGDGMVYRLDLSPGAITLSSACVVDPTFTAHALLHADRQRAERDKVPLQFPDIPPYVAYGVAIVSLERGAGGAVRGLGSRLLSNTALVPLNIGERPMLLVTTDGGRPIVFDPSRMTTIGALGAVKQWRPALLGKTLMPFVNTTAHPAYDGRTGELFSINFARNLVAEAGALVIPGNKPASKGPLGEAEPADPADPAVPSSADYVSEAALLDLFKEHPALHDASLSKDELGIIPGAGVFLSGSLGAQPKGLLDGVVEGAIRLISESVADTFRTVIDGAETVGSRLRAMAATMYSDVGQRFTDLMCWSDDLKTLRTFKVMCQGREVMIVDSAHQMAVTRNHVIFADTQFKFALSLVLSNALDNLPDKVARALRRHLTRAQAPQCRMYFVRRSDLEPGGIGDVAGQRVVQARCLILDAEVVHFFAEYEDTEATVLTVVHQRAMDGAEFVTASDLDFNEDKVRKEVVGMFPMSLDLNEVARYRINGNQSGLVKPYVSLTEADHTWMVGIGAGPGVGTWERRSPERSPPERLAWTAWYNEGFVPDLVTRHTYELYRKYRGRTEDNKGRANVPLREIGKQVQAGGKPATFFVTREQQVGASKALVVATAMRLPRSVQLVSPQWLPARGDPAHPGFLVGVVFRDEVQGADEATREVWVFRADQLDRPILRFDAREAGWQYTLHTAWLDALDDPAAADPGVPAQIAFRNDLPGMKFAPDDPLRALIDAVYGSLPGGGAH